MKNWVWYATAKFLGMHGLEVQHEGQQTWYTTTAVFQNEITVSEMQPVHHYYRIPKDSDHQVCHLQSE